MKKIKINKVAVKTIKKEDLEHFIAEKLMEAGVDQAYLSQLSSLLKRELEAKKDTDDYNKNLISESLDKVIKVFMEGGLDSFTPGEYIQLNEKMTENFDKKKHTQDFQISAEDGVYEKFPFSQVVVSEIRAQYLLQTSLKDSFKGLIDEFQKLAKNIMEEPELKMVLSCIKKSESRIFKNSLKFPSPPRGFEQGLLRKISEEEKKENGLSEDIMIDERFDNHDLLALKDLILLLKGKKASALSLGPSFFCKYMPEIKESGFSGVFVSFENGIITKMKLMKLPNDTIEYSPVLASLNVVFNELLDVEILPKNEKYKSIPFKIKKNNKDLFTKNKMYFVVVDGCVAIPSTKVPFNYESYSKNDSILKSGELFVFEKNDNEEIVQTRTCFVPYNYEGLNILHQHGSSIFGSNDQSFQSCYQRQSSLSYQLIDNYKDFWHNLVKENLKPYGDAFSPAVVASRLHHFLKNGDKPSDPSDIFKDENIRALDLAMSSISEQTDFTKKWILNTMHWENMRYSLDIYDMVASLCQHEAPLNRRWLLKQYLEDGVGITKEKQATYYIKLAENLEQNKYTEQLDILLKITEAKKYVAQGMDFSEALEKLFK